MEVYCVMVICDEEYGCRDIESIWATQEQAEARIVELGQETVEMWFGNEDLYTIESHTLQGLDK